MNSLCAGERHRAGRSGACLGYRDVSHGYRVSRNKEAQLRESGRVAEAVRVRRLNWE